MTRTRKTDHPRMHKGSTTWKLTGVMLEFELERRDVYLTTRELMAAIGAEPTRIAYNTVLRNLWRMREAGLINVITSWNGDQPSRWQIPADFGDRYDRWLDLEDLEPGWIRRLARSGTATPLTNGSIRRGRITLPTPRSDHHYLKEDGS